MALHSFCGILTLQVGVAIIAIVFWVIAILTFVVNFFEFFEPSPNDDFPVYTFSISTFVILLILAGLITFFSAYNENNTLCMAGVGLICLITVIWVILSSLSFYNDQSIMKFICINDRCPETFWLAPLQYRLTKENHPKHHHNDDDYSSPVVNTTTPVNQEKRSVDLYLTRRYIQNLKFNENQYFLKDEFDHEEVPTNVVTTGGYEFGLPLIGAVVLFICNFLFLLFSILVLWSYGQELVWTDNYLRDITEI